jgi:surface protein
MLKINLLYPLAVSSLLLFSACFNEVAYDKIGKDIIPASDSGESEKEAKTLEGQLIDSAVEGVRYETDSGKTGYTNKNGTFSYSETDKTITFQAGSLVIAKDFTLSKMKNDSQILPSDIAGVDRNNTTDEKVVKLLRVLQSLDNDNNASNGIHIDDNTKGYLSEDINIIDANISTLKIVVEKAQKKLISQKQSRMHYAITLKNKGTKAKAMPFVTIWKTTSDNEDITISANSDYISDYNYTVNWGDGTIENDVNDSITHTYISAGSHTVKISGKFPAISGKYPAKKANSEKLQTITQWGDIAWSSFDSAFRNCSNLDVNATDTPALSKVGSTDYMFYNAKNLKGNKYFNDWDVSSVTSMYNMFSRATVFNQPLKNWDVSKVRSMSGMFYYATAFNQPLNKWNVSSVTNMGSMFVRADAFNQPVNKWNVSSVTIMNLMFNGTIAFNQPLNDWDVSNVTDMRFMFEFTSAFNQPLDKWNVSSVTDMGRMFYQATAFNQPLNSWNVSSVTSMLKMFQDAIAFNQPLDNWNVSNVTNMKYMFRDASAFTGQDLSSWDVANVKIGYYNGFAAGSGTGNTLPTWK